MLTFFTKIIPTILPILVLFSNHVKCKDTNLTSFATTIATYSPPSAIGPKDTITVQNKQLYKQSTNAKFYLKGIAFPDPPPSTPYNAQGWIDMLHQLHNLQTPYNAVRIYRMDPKTDYSEFFNEAAKLGVYVMVPLTSAQGKGVINRDAASPKKCYTRSLFRYGKSCIRNYIHYPNVIAGLIGNEVMNSVQTWISAPCVKAYGRDLKTWMRYEVKKGAIPRVLPLVYAAQNTGLGAAASPARAMKLTVDYLTCIPNVYTWERATLRRQQQEQELKTVSKNHENPTTTSTKQTWFHHKSGEMQKDNDDDDDDDDDDGTAIDIFGINVESWCSSFDTYKTNADGTTGTYYQLHQGLQNASIPLLFSEMGCGHDLYNHDLYDKEHLNDHYSEIKNIPENTDGPKRKKGERTWSQIPFVLNEMSDSWAGFFAYAYAGSPEFVMFDNGPWDGVHTLTPTADFYSWKEQLDKAMMVAAASNSTSEDTTNDAWMREVMTTPPLCSTVELELKEVCDIELQDFNQISSFVRQQEEPASEYLILLIVSLIVVGWASWKIVNVRQMQLSRKEYEMIV